MSAAPTQRELTRYATRYGTSRNVLFRGTGKSGLTPILFQADSSAADEAAIDEFKAREDYQRSILRTFTTWELEESGCLSKADAKPSDLEVPIHKILIKSRWLASSNNIGGGIQGTWEAKNNVVWKILKPILRLSTKLLAASCLWLWFDALINADWVKLPASQFNDGGHERDLYGIRAREPQVAANATLKITEVWEKLKGKLRFDIQPSKNNARNRNSKTNSFLQSVHQNQDPKDLLSLKITLALELLAPLLKSELNVTETLMQQFFVAKVILHEMAHVAVRYIQSLDIPNHPSPVFPVQPEPFFEDEESNECGRALENAVWGGYVTDFWIVRSDLRFSKMDSWAVLSVCVHNWVNFKFFPPDLRVVLPEQRQRIRFSENFQENAIASYWPVPVTFMENILQTDYWDTQVAQFTTQAFKPDRIFGHIIVRGATSKPEDESYLIALGPKYDDWVTESGKRVSTMEKIDYRTMDDIRYGKLIPADKQWRPIFDQTEAHAQKIQDAIDQQDRISNARKRRLSGAQGQATTKKQNTGTASPAGSTAGPPSSAGSSSRSRSASPSGSQSPLGC